MSVLDLNALNALPKVERILALAETNAHLETLDAEGFNHVKIMVSGGFTAEKIQAFEAEKTPADVYAVGSSLFNDNVNFTADIVSIEGKPCAKVGRHYRENPRLCPVD